MGAISKTVYYEYNQGIPFDKVPTGFYKNSVAILGNDFINNYCHYDLPQSIYKYGLLKYYWDVLDYPAFSTKHGSDVEIVCQKAYHNAIANGDYKELNSCFERQEHPLSEPKLKSHEADLKTTEKRNLYMEEIEMSFKKYGDLAKYNNDYCKRTLGFKQFLNYTSSKNRQVGVLLKKLASIQYGKLDTKGCYKSFEKNMKISNQNANNDLFVISKFLSDNELDGICIIWDYKEKTLEDVSGIREMINQLKSIINNNKDVSVLIKAPEEKEKDLYEYFANNIMKSQFKPNTVYFLATSTYVENELKEVETLFTEPKISYTQPLIRTKKPMNVKQRIL
ncbi:hypothetical protein BB560_007179 [Smittium megazygosporum]|uniref:Uncharacterized protein n=1 Tax=Smittium megazygosporum TaxID=133381 RepID=A0A2T9XY73_9FUNG|nr:hypothetical protein BB560_007179 [Smittium megazygosporum]